MEMLLESWCFCSGGGRKSDRLRDTIAATKSAAMARLSTAAGEGGVGAAVGTGFLIRRNLLLTTHVTLPSATAAEAAVIRLENGVLAALVPHRFFVTSSILDLTVVGLDTIELDSNSQGPQLHHLKPCSKLNLNLGCSVFVLGYTDNKELNVGEGKVVIATDSLIKLSTDGPTWSPGSAGFDANGNLAFLICDPMKLASSTSSSSWKKERRSQFGIPMPVISDWLNQHTTEPYNPSFTMRRVFKASETDEVRVDIHDPDGIRTPDIRESPKTSSEIPLLDGNSGSEEICANAISSKLESLEIGDTKSEVDTLCLDDTEESESSIKLPKEAKIRRTTNAHKNLVVRKSLAEKRSSLTRQRKSVSQGTASRRSNVSSPTVSSIMKKRDGSVERPKPLTRTRKPVVSSSPRWAY